MKVGILGPVVLVGNDGVDIPVGSPKARSVLACLALQPKAFVSLANITRYLWGEFPPATATKAVRTYIWSLRRVLPDNAIESSTGGYRLDVDPDNIDACRFEQLLGAGARALDEGDPCAAVRLFTESLQLWRGDPLDGVTDDGPGQLQASRLIELKRRAEECRSEAQLALGEDASIIPDLQALAAAEPLREERWAHLLLAMYRAGRQADALRTYSQVRKLLAEELGIEPSEQLRHLEIDILQQNPALDGEYGGRTTYGADQGSGRCQRGDADAGTTSDSPAPSGGNLPSRRGELIGRASEIEALAGLLGESRLVTLVGPGGVGKSRLLREVGWQEKARYADGAWILDLASITRAVSVAESLAMTLGVDSPDTRSAVEVVREHVSRRRILVVLDNCEHLLLPVAELVEVLLDGGPEVTVLTASREPLRVRDEVVFAVAPLRLPDPTDDPTHVLNSDAVRLFIERALAARRDLHFLTSQSGALAQIVIRLDGLPLAIELAAARLNTLGLLDLVEMLEDPLRLLRGGSRTDRDHQKTLSATLEWSYRLLDQRAKRGFRCLSVFAGTFDLDAAGAVLTDEGDPDDQLEVISELVAKSLVCTVDANGHARYRLLETVRHYAGNLLKEHRESDAVHNRHLAWALALTTPPGHQASLSEQASWLDRLENDMDNLRHALDWALSNDVGKGLRLAVNIRELWVDRGYLSEGRRWLVDLLAVSGAPATPLDIEALLCLAVLAYAQGDNAPALAASLQAVELARHAGEPSTLGYALGRLAWGHSLSGRVVVARALFDEALVLGEGAGDERLVGATLRGRSVLEIVHGSAKAALADARRSYEIAMELGDLRMVASTLAVMAECERASGDYPAAVFLVEEKLRYSQTIGDAKDMRADLLNAAQYLLENSELDRAEERLTESLACGRSDEFVWPEQPLVLGEIMLMRGDIESAQELVEAALLLAPTPDDADALTLAQIRRALGEISQARGDLASAMSHYKEAVRVSPLSFIPACLEAIASLLVARGDYVHGAMLLAAAQRERVASVRPIPPYRQPIKDRQVALIKSRVSATECDQAWKAGQNLPIEAATSVALDLLDRATLAEQPQRV